MIDPHSYVEIVIIVVGGLMVRTTTSTYTRINHVGSVCSIFRNAEVAVIKGKSK